MSNALFKAKRMFVLASCLLALASNAADTDLTFSGAWRSADDIVNGWDWTLPPGIKPSSGSGIFNLNSAVPSDFPGYHLKQVNAKWKDLEPSEGQYDFRSITAALNDTNYDGVMLNIRGMVVSIADANGNPALSAEITAPEWLSRSVPKVTEPLRNGYRITNMKIYDPAVEARLLKLIKAFGESGIPRNEKLVAQIIHGVSGSRGEECCAGQDNSAAVEATMQKVIMAWSSAFGQHSKKLAWLKEEPASLFDAAVHEGGTGVRGGIIENWIRGQYTPGDSSQTGQVYENGYLVVDESFAPIAQNRAWMDENEALDRKFSSPERLQQNYRMASLRMLQMRRNIAWTESNSGINPRLLNWMSLEFGKNVSTAPDAWVVLMRTWTRSGGDKEVKNLERWLYQRDASGVSTMPTLKRDHSYNASGNDSLDSSKWFVEVARSGDAIGIAIDDRFLMDGPHEVAIKVTYFDLESTEWYLEYSKPDGTRARKTVRGAASNMARTATFFLSDLVAPRKGTDFDFWLRSSSGNTPFMFVRVIKLDPSSSSGDAAPSPPDAVSVE
jgi:hypothetical protein